jgi:hypothetical protein
MPFFNEKGIKTNKCNRLLGKVPFVIPDHFFKKRRIGVEGEPQTPNPPRFLLFAEIFSEKT